MITSGKFLSYFEPSPDLPADGFGGQVVEREIFSAEPAGQVTSVAEADKAGFTVQNQTGNGLLGQVVSGLAEVSWWADVGPAISDQNQQGSQGVLTLEVMGQGLVGQL